MSYFEDQEDAWFENDCKGRPDEYNPFDPDSWPRKHTAPMDVPATVSTPAPTPKRTKSQKRNDQRKRAKAARRAAGVHA